MSFDEKVIVIGDSMLDEYIHGTCQRISPEAPVPVVQYQKTEIRLGGAANVAANVASLSGSAVLASPCSTETHGLKFISLLDKYNITLLSRTAESMVVKSRIISGGQQIARIDFEGTNAAKPYSNYGQLDCCGKIVIASDYDKGTLSSPQLHNYDKLLVDPKRNFKKWTDVYLMKPNLKEYLDAFGSNFEAVQYMKTNNVQNMLVTTGSDGAFLIDQTGSMQYFTTQKRSVVDVTGSGDVVIAVIAYCLSEGYTLEDSIKQGLHIASKGVETVGCYVAETGDLHRTVFTNGCFDVFHSGHVKLLKYAKSLGDKLVVGLNSDESVKKLKGDGRPIIPCEHRKKLLEELPFVDEVLVFDEETPLNLIRTVKPSIIVKGGDYNPEQVIGNELAKVVIFPLEDNVSTTKLMEKR